MVVLVTGASGFVGTALVQALSARGIAVRGAYRTQVTRGGQSSIVGDIGPDTDWGAALQGVETVVHLAAIAHRSGAAALHQRVTVEGAAALAKQSVEAGVTRFILLSSVLAGGETSAPGAPLVETMPPAPQSDYGRAKREAEERVGAYAALRSVILRPPLLFGPGAKANAGLLLTAADTPWPLPLAGFAARRNYMALANLVVAIEQIIAAPNGPAGTYYVADQPSLSIGQVVSALRVGLGRPARVFATPFPAPRAVRQTLEVDDRAFCAAYGYGARGDVSATDALAEAARAWKAARL